MYSDKNRMSVDYDFTISEEDLEFLNGQEMSDGQLTIEDFIGGNNSALYESIFTAVDTDGLEEITGNYIPDNSQ